jgi:Bacterial protein of unknown function (DUF885)
MTVDSGVETRLRAVRELMIGSMREDVGMHEYDGVVQDFSAGGVAAGLAALHRPTPPSRLQRLGLGGPARPVPHDEAHLRAFETGLHWYFGDYQAHRRDPQLHLSNLDLACYDREYAPLPQRAAAKAAHLAQWPAAIDVAVSVLDAVPAPVASALLGSARGLAQPLLEPGPEGPVAAPDVVQAALAAHGRLVGHLERLAQEGDPDCAVGAHHLERFMGAFEGLDVDVRDLATQADSERNRCRALLAQACSLIDPHRPTREVVTALLADHPQIGQVLTQARAITAEALDFTRQHQLVPWTDGECLVGPAPASRSWAMAMMSWAGPYEDDTASWYHVTPPDPSWPQHEIDEWLSVFSATTLPAITVHEVAPGHYAHSRALRRVTSPVRRQLLSMTFAEGWAHYAEEMAIEAGFRSADPRFAAGVFLEALIRTTRLTCAIGLHSGALDVAAAAALFETDAFLSPAAARSEAARGTFDVSYGRYTQGKLALRELQAQARTAWGAGFSLPHFHAALLGLGSPPLALAGRALTA